MITLARKLRERGQDVSRRHADCEPPLRAADSNFTRLGTAIPARFRREMEAHLSKPHGLAGSHTLERFLALFEEELGSSEVLRETAEAAVIDEVFSAAVEPAAADPSQTPADSSVRQCSTPFTDWPHRSGLVARLKPGGTECLPSLRPFRL